MPASPSLERLSALDVERMSYNELIGLVRETNRPPGGASSIARVAERAFIGRSHSILEIGTSTGVAAIELARLTGAKITSIDINPVSLKEAAERARRYRVSNRIHFRKVDASSMPFRSGSFDVVFCGNVTSLIASRDRALDEYCRVLKTGGFLAAIPMYYRSRPSATLLREVSEAIRVPVSFLEKSYWHRFFDRPPLEHHFCEDYSFDSISAETVTRFSKAILSRHHLSRLTPATKTALNAKYQASMQLFRRNLAKMGYSIMLLRKEPEPMDPELFTSRRV